MAKQCVHLQRNLNFEAASLIVDQKYSYPEACRALDTGESALRCWVTWYSSNS